MPSRPTWFWTSLFSSIGVNAVLLFSWECWFYSETKVFLPGHARGEAAGPVYVNSLRIPSSILGAANGKGDATDATPGDDPLQATAADQVQAFMSRDPEGPGKIGDEPSMSTQIPGENGSGEDGAPMFALAMAQATPPPQPQFVPMVQNRVEEATKPKADALVQTTSATDALVETKAPADATVETKSPLDVLVNAKAPPEAPVETRNPPAEAGSPAEQFASIQETPAPPAPQILASAAQPQRVSSGGGKPGPSVVPADPAPQTDSESDPFSKQNSVTFKRGATDVQLGRKHKIIRPRLGLSGQIAMLPPNARLILGLAVDETGNVVSVQVLQSSGNKDIDQACKVAAYQWWLEPTRNKAGKAIKDVIAFPIRFL